MRCPYCGAEKLPRVWVCAECNSPIPRPKKPAYEAAGWEWIAALVFLALLWLWFLLCPLLIAAEEIVIMLTLFWFAVAFAFGAARDEEIFPRVVGILCLTIVTALSFGMALLYVLVIVLVEQARWRLKVARM